ncbi:type-F conjugative transfer system secretin TraK [Alcanivorax sp.]|uniref:TraK domain-containing protein n=1 Tax=Alcanivorax sp. TaxID=1872427 RepID=UPI00258985F5|nr:type-F conjugative transfer system secretin TraK [Alcanivorax sp.]
MMQFIKVFFLALCFFAGSVFAAESETVSNVQNLPVRDGDSITVNVSSRELTRVGISGAGRLEKVWGAAGIMEINPDRDKGEVFIRPLAGAPKSFSFFVRDDQGATYTLVATQRDIPSQTVMLSPADLRVSSYDKSRWKSQPFVINVKKLLKGMALGKDVPGYQIEPRQSKVPLWKETDIRQVRAYVGFALVGEVYLVTNNTEETLRFHEREFMDFGEGVNAVALEKLDVAPGDFTTLYIVRKAEEK